MEAQQLIASATYGPETLRVLFQAFDEAWQTVAPSCGENTLAIHATRLKLANAILGLARDGCTDVQVLKEAALKGVGHSGAAQAHPGDQRQGACGR